MITDPALNLHICGKVSNWFDIICKIFALEEYEALVDNIWIEDIDNDQNSNACSLFEVPLSIHIFEMFYTIFYSHPNLPENNSGKNECERGCDCNESLNEYRSCIRDICSSGMF